MTTRAMLAALCLFASGCSSTSSAAEPIQECTCIGGCCRHPPTDSVCPGHVAYVCTGKTIEEEGGIFFARDVAGRAKCEAVDPIQSYAGAFCCTK